jgi:hypothetical protein
MAQKQGRNWGYWAQNAVKVVKFIKIVGVQSRTECRPWNVRAQGATSPHPRGRQYHFFCDIISYQYHGQKSDIISCIYHLKKNDII